MDNAVRLTGLWKNQDKSGNQYLSGSVNAMTKALIMKNNRKQKESEPD